MWWFILYHPSWQVGYLSNRLSVKFISFTSAVKVEHCQWLWSEPGTDCRRWSEHHNCRWHFDVTWRGDVSLQSIFRWLTSCATTSVLSWTAPQHFLTVSLQSLEKEAALILLLLSSSFNLKHFAWFQNGTTLSFSSPASLRQFSPIFYVLCVPPCRYGCAVVKCWSPLVRVLVMYSVKCLRTPGLGAWSTSSTTTQCVRPKSGWTNTRSSSTKLTLVRANSVNFLSQHKHRQDFQFWSAGW